MKKNANICEYKVGINAIIANFVFVKMSNDDEAQMSWDGTLQVVFVHQDNLSRALHN